MKKCVQYGWKCVAFVIWINYDVSQTHEIQRISVLSIFLKSRLNAIFPKNVRYDGIIKVLLWLSKSKK